jgi:hypothetical protein
MEMEVATMTRNRLRPILVLLFAFLVVLPLAWVGESHAQARPQGSASTAGDMRQIEGAIKSVEPTGRMLTLADGTELTLPPTANLPPGALKEGDIVEASYEENGGQKVVTSLEIQKP